MTTQTTLNLVTKLPFSEVPRSMWRGKPCLNQKALQMSGEFTQCDSHPVYEGLFYWGKTHKGNQWWATKDLWKNRGVSTPTEVHEKQREAREHNLTKTDSEPRVLEDGKKVGCVDQQSMQVSWRPTQGDFHPKYPNYRYWGKRSNGDQRWFTLEAFNKISEQRKASKKTPEYRAAAAMSRALRRLSINYKFKLTDEQFEELVEIYLDCFAINEAAVGAGMYGRGFNGRSRYAFNVDHIQPLTNKALCGLHAPWNVQIMEAGENMSKSNKIFEEYEKALAELPS